MFKISKKGEYGVEVLIALSKSKADNLISIKQISEQYHLPKSFLSQVMSDLKKAGLVISKEGVSGGYKIAKDLSSITLLEVLQVFEKGTFLVDCMCPNSGGCSREAFCSSKSSWSSISRELISYFENKKLSDLI